MKAMILAGGHSERFGKPKAFAEIEGQPFYKKIINTLTSTNMFNEVIISTNEQLAPLFEHQNVVIDDNNSRNKGPLAGIYSVMKQYSDEELFFVVSVDTPMITSKAISGLYQFMISHLIEDRLDIAAFKDAETKIPTIAFYSPHALKTIEAALQSDDYSLRHVYNQLSTDWLDVSEIHSPHYWYDNINYQQDLDSLKTKIRN